MERTRFQPLSDRPGTTSWTVFQGCGPWECSLFNTLSSLSYDVEQPRWVLVFRFFFGIIYACGWSFVIVKLCSTQILQVCTLIWAQCALLPISFAVVFIISLSALHALIFRSKALLELSDQILMSLDCLQYPQPPQQHTLVPRLLTLILQPGGSSSEISSTSTAISEAPEENVVKGEALLENSDVSPFSTSTPSSKAIVRLVSSTDLCWEQPLSATLEEVAQCAVSQLQLRHETLASAQLDELPQNLKLGVLLRPWRRATFRYFVATCFIVLYETFSWNLPLYQTGLLTTSFQQISGITFATVEGSCYILFSCIFSLMRWSQVILAAHVQAILYGIRTDLELSVTLALRSIQDLAHNVRRFSNIFEPYVIASSTLTTSLILLETAVYVYNIVEARPIGIGDEVGMGFLFMLLYFWGMPLYIAWDVNKTWKYFLDELNELKVETGQGPLTSNPDSVLLRTNLEIVLKYAERKEVGFRCFGIVIGRDWLQRTTFVNIFITFLGALSIRLASYGSKQS